MRQIRVRNAECLTNEIIGAKTGHKAHKVRYSKTNIWHAVNSLDISMHQATTKPHHHTFWYKNILFHFHQPFFNYQFNSLVQHRLRLDTCQSTESRVVKSISNHTEDNLLVKICTSGSNFTIFEFHVLFDGKKCRN